MTSPLPDDPPETVPDRRLRDALGLVVLLVGVVTVLYASWRVGLTCFLFVLGVELAALGLLLGYDRDRE